MFSTTDKSSLFEQRTESNNLKSKNYGVTGIFNDLSLYVTSSGGLASNQKVDIPINHFFI